MFLKYFQYYTRYVLKTLVALHWLSTLRSTNTAPDMYLIY